MKHTLKTAEDGTLYWDPPFSAEEEAKHKQNLEEMVRLGKGPAISTGDTFRQGRRSEQERLRSMYGKQARAAGRDVSGMVYQSGLARFPGDPEAWVESRDELKNRLEERGWGGQGEVNVKPRMDDDPHDYDVPLAQDIVDEEVERRIEENPDLAQSDRGEIEHEVREKHTPHWAK